MTVIGKIITITALFLVTGCETRFSSYDHYSINEMRRLMIERKMVSNDIVDDLILYGYEDLAHKAAQEGDHKLIAMTMGYQATKDDAEIFGVVCEDAAETVPVVYGCVPPPIAIMKLVYYFNESLINHPDFPKEWKCKVNSEVIVELQDISGKQNRSYLLGKQERYNP
ncbi:MAG: hypothetical protein ACK4NR_08785 [Micavibrio sp.]